MPQGERTDEEKAAFGRMLGNINLLFLGASVLILLDMSYSSRFWTQFEAWTSFQEVNEKGVMRSASEANRRCEIICIHNANEYTKLGLIEMWSDKSPDEAHDILSREDVSVTNQKDKDLQLPKIKTFKDSVHKTWLTIPKDEDERSCGQSPATRLIPTSRAQQWRLPLRVPRWRGVGRRKPSRHRSGAALRRRSTWCTLSRSMMSRSRPISWRPTSS